MLGALPSVECASLLAPEPNFLDDGKTHFSIVATRERNPGELGGGGGGGGGGNGGAHTVVGKLHGGGGNKGGGSKASGAAGAATGKWLRLSGAGGGGGGGGSASGGGTRTHVSDKDEALARECVQSADSSATSQITGDVFLALREPEIVVDASGQRPGRLFGVLRLTMQRNGGGGNGGGGGSNPGGGGGGMLGLQGLHFIREAMRMFNTAVGSPGVAPVSSRMDVGAAAACSGCGRGCPYCVAALDKARFIIGFRTRRVHSHNIRLSSRSPRSLARLVQRSTCIRCSTFKRWLSSQRSR